MTSLVRVQAGRPPFVQVEGGVIISIATHDHYYRETRKAYKRQLADLHPDRHCLTRFQSRNEHGPYMRKMGKHYKGRRFMIKLAQYTAWLTRELHWYRNFGLLPPR